MEKQELRAALRAWLDEQDKQDEKTEIEKALAIREGIRCRLEMASRYLDVQGAGLILQGVICWVPQPGPELHWAEALQWGILLKMTEEDVGTYLDPCHIEAFLAALDRLRRPFYDWPIGDREAVRVSFQVRSVLEIIATAPDCPQIRIGDRLLQVTEKVPDEIIQGFGRIVEAVKQRAAALQVKQGA